MYNLGVKYIYGPNYRELREFLHEDYFFYYPREWYEQEDFEYSSSEIETTSLEVIAHLKENNKILSQSPCWWGTDYPPDPREYLPHEEFKNRMIPFFVKEETEEITEYYFYPRKEVPITTVELEVYGEKCVFLVTARPCTDGYSLSDLEYLTHPLEYESEVFNNYIPHIRGVLASVRGNKFFWYPIRLKFYSEIRESLKGTSFEYLDPRKNDYLCPVTYRVFDSNFSELEKIPAFLTKKLFRPEFTKMFDLYGMFNSYEAYRNEDQLQLEEFLQCYKDRKNLKLLYPVTLNCINTTIPLFIANRMPDSDDITGPLVYGSLTCGGSKSSRAEMGIVRIVDPIIAKLISSTLSRDFGIKVKTLLYKPRKGKSIYEPVLGKDIEDTYQHPLIFKRDR
jgi:hypothetical protein